MIGSTGLEDEEEGADLLLRILVKGPKRIGEKLVPGLIEALKGCLTMDG